MKKILIFLLKALFAVGILTWLILKNGVTFKEISNISPVWPILAVAALLTQITLTGVRWCSLLRCVGVRLRFPEVLSLTMQGVFYTLFIPGGSVGGDLVKAGILAKRSVHGQKFNGVFSILVDRLCGLAALMIVTLASCLWSLPEINSFPPKIRYFVFTFSLLCAAVLAACFAAFFHDFFYRFPRIRKLLEFADKYSKGAFSNAANAMAAYRDHWKLMLFWLVCTSGVFFTLLAAALWFLGRGIAGEFLSAKLTLLASNLSNTAAAIPLTNGGIGTRDLMTTSILKAGGCAESVAAAIPILYTGVFLGTSLLGSFFVIFDNFFHKDDEKNLKNHK